MITTLLVEQDEIRRTALSCFLASTRNHRMLAFADAGQPTDEDLGEAAMALLSTDIPNAINRISRTVTATGRTAIPIVILANSTERDDLAAAVESCGHVEILTKPFAGSDLLAAMHAVITEQHYRHETPFRIGPVEVIPATMHIAHPDGTIHPITNMQLRLLVCLLNARGIPLNRQDLLAKVWGYAPNTTTSTIDTHIYQLRQKIETDPSNPAVIVHGDHGYVIKATDGEAGQERAHG